jgi:hypothetical protein
MSRFDSARRAALMADLLRPLRGQPADLLRFEEVRERLRLRTFVDRGRREVPLDAIVGSLGRAREFSRAFLPRDESLRERWERVEDLAEGPEGLDAVELYQVGDAYFVVDGHHRVSVARQMGAATIEAHVTEYLSPVRLEPDASIEEVILDGALADFLGVTGLDPADAEEYRVSEAGGYQRLLDHITVHRYFRGIDLGREFAWAEAVASWRDLVFLPTVATIRESGVLADFPGRTAADLYLFTMDHLHFLRERYGSREIEPEVAVRHFRWLSFLDSPLQHRLRTWWRRLWSRPGSAE